MQNTTIECESGEYMSMCEYADFELCCPFCECGIASIVSKGDRDVEYACHNCGGEWNVLER